MNIVPKNANPHISSGRWDAYKGYTLLSPVEGRRVDLIDMKGVPVQTWEIPFALGSHAELLPNGNLLCAAKAPEGPLVDFEGVTGRLVEMDWDGNVVWEYEDLYMHHNFYRMANGDTIVLRWVCTPSDVAANVKGGLPGTEKGGVMWSDSLREINPAGKVVWEWLGYEHLDPKVDIICPLCFRNEWTHANSFVVTPHSDILISLMKTNNVVVVSKETGKIVWRWGGFLKLAHPSSVACLGDEDVMVLGNSIHVPGFERGFSEVLTINIKNNNMMWEFRAPTVDEFYTSCKGGLQRLPNDNTLVCEGDMGHVFELTNDKEIVWEFINPFYNSSPTYGRNNMLFQAYRYGFDYGGLKGNVAKLDRVQPVPEEKGQQRVEKAYASEGEQALHDRLSSLGY